MAVEAAFNQEKALAGANFMITNLRVNLHLQLYCRSCSRIPVPQLADREMQVMKCRQCTTNYTEGRLVTMISRI